jgi:N-acetylmuramoyl-L-alanine amidase
MTLRPQALSVAARSALALLVLLVLAGCETLVETDYGRLQPAGFFNTVVIDAGHGGHDRGARAYTGRHEKDLVLDTSRRLARILRASGLRVVETRTGDYFVPLGKRVEKLNRMRNAIFVSIHYNWAKRSSARGIETFYHSSRSSRLAANIQDEMIRVYRTPNRGIKNRGFYVLRNSRRPAVLLELGFLSNKAENAIVQRSSTRQRLAEAIARGILAERAGRNP